MQNAYLPIQHLDRPPLDAGGLCYFYFIPIEDVLQWPSVNPQSGSIVDDVVLKAEKTWMRCMVIENGKAYEEKLKSSDSGNYWEININGFLPGDSPINNLSVNKMKHRRFAVVTKERNGIMRLMGEQHNGVAFQADYSSADVNGVRGRSLSFSWVSQDTCPLYLTAVSADGEVINPPWTPPVSPGGSGRMVYDPIYIEPSDGQNSYTDANLIGKTILAVFVPPVVMYPGQLQTQFSFSNSTGTVSFHNPLRLGQNVIILYADAL